MDKVAFDVNYLASGDSVEVSGRAWSPSGVWSGYTARHLDPETGLLHYRARAYSPFLHQFAQRDPIGYLDSASLYQYVAGRVLHWVDPFGLYWVGGEPDPGSIGTGGALAKEIASLEAQIGQAIARGDVQKAQELLKKLQDLIGAVSGAAKDSALFPHLQRLIDLFRSLGGRIGDLSRRAKDLWENAVNAVKDHVRPSDLIGAWKDFRKIWSGGKHLKEVQDAIRSIRNLIDALKSQLDHLLKTNGDPALIAKLQEQIAALEAYIFWIISQIMGPTCPS